MADRPAIPVKIIAPVPPAGGLAGRFVGALGRLGLLAGICDAVWGDRGGRSEQAPLQGTDDESYREEVIGMR